MSMNNLQQLLSNQVFLYVTFVCYRAVHSESLKSHIIDNKLSLFICHQTIERPKIKPVCERQIVTIRRIIIPKLHVRSIGSKSMCKKMANQDRDEKKENKARARFDRKPRLKGGRDALSYRRLFGRCEKCNGKVGG